MASQVAASEAQWRSEKQKLETAWGDRLAQELASAEARHRAALAEQLERALAKHRKELGEARSVERAAAEERIAAVVAESGRSVRQAGRQSVRRW